MRTCGLAAWLCALACAMPLPDARAGAADPQRRIADVQALLDDFGQRGFGAGDVDLQRLRDAGPLPDSAPQALRREYQSALALLAQTPEEAQAAVATLEAMASLEGCRDCTTELLLLRLNQAVDEGNTAGVRTLQEQLRGREPMAAPRGRFNMALTEARALDLLGDAQGALEAALQATQLASRQGARADQVAGLEQLARVNSSRRDFNRALRYYDEALKLSREVGNARFVVSQLINLGYVHAALKDRPRQHQALREALALARAEPPMPFAELICLNNLAHYFNGEQNGHEQAYAHAAQAERLAMKLGDRVTLAFARANRGVAMVHLGQVEAGLMLARSGVEAVRAMGLALETADLLEQLSLAYEAARRPTEAIAALRERMATLDGLARTQDERAVQELQEHVDAERRTHEIERLSLLTRRNEAEVAARTLQQRVWGVGALVLVLTGVLTARGVALLRRRNRSLAAGNAQLDEASRRDALTGVFNRRHAAEQLNGRAADAAPLGLVLVDVDHFKRINDTLGHAAGDAVLVEFGTRLKAAVRATDFVARLAGDEFVVVLEGVHSAVECEQVAAKILSSVRRPMPAEGMELSVTTSIGIAYLPGGGRAEPAALLALADRALYETKAEGRNGQTCLVAEAPATAEALA